MLTNELRPLTWNDMAGQKINKQILKSIVKNPETSPKSLIFEGEFGCGKTTSARIMARELNGIKDPNYDLNNSPFYFEYDSTVIGNVDKIRELRDVFGTGSADYWQVIVFDETHAISNQAQTALLKILEEVKGKTFFICCTTHVHKVIPTIRSRSLELKFGLVPYEEIKEHLDEVTSKLGVDIGEDIKGIIASRSGGHMRNAHMLLDKYLLIGDETFRASVKSSIDLYCEFFRSIKSNNQVDVMKTLNELNTVPLNTLKSDLNEVILLCMKSFSGVAVSNPKVEELTKLYGTDIMKLVKFYFSDWVKNIFESDYHFITGMLCFYNILSAEVGNGGGVSGGVGSKPQVTNNMQNRAMVRR